MRSLLSALAVASAFVLSACGGGSSGSSATQVRLLNATQSYAALDLSVDDKTKNTAVAYAQVGSYAEVDTGATATKVLTSTVGTSVAATTPTLTSGSHYTYVAYGWAGAIRTTLLQEDVDKPDSGKAKLLVLNLAPDAGALDIYVTTADESIDSATALTSNLSGGSGSGYNTLNAGTFRVRVTGYNKRSDLRLDIPAVTLDSAGVSTLILTATGGGVLVNGLHLVQQGSASSFANGRSRVRTVAALAGGATVAGAVNGAQLLPTSVSPTLGDYVSTPAGASVLSLSVNGAPLNVAAPTLKAGADYTLLVWGDAASPQFTVLTDDNRLPATSGNVKIRMVNALAAQNSGLTLNLDYSALATNVLPGTSSDISNVSSTTTGLLNINSPSSITPLYSLSDLTLVANGVYTVFMLGDPAKSVGTLRRER